ncbi:Uncharacterized protein Fot_50976 [Forsythia ovata]|uniref:Uncharacterized protein n=1 Tax=Forsythia ovata TaxID=205694 RepID=A0ABD1PXP0_9LAMI
MKGTIIPADSRIHHLWMLPCLSISPPTPQFCFAVCLDSRHQAKIFQSQHDRWKRVLLLHRFCPEHVRAIRKLGRLLISLVSILSCLSERGMEFIVLSEIRLAQYEME